MGIANELNADWSKSGEPNSASSITHVDQRIVARTSEADREAALATQEHLSKVALNGLDVWAHTPTARMADHGVYFGTEQ